MGTAQVLKGPKTSITSIAMQLSNIDGLEGYMVRAFAGGAIQRSRSKGIETAAITMTRQEASHKTKQGDCDLKVTGTGQSAVLSVACPDMCDAVSSSSSSL